MLTVEDVKEDIVLSNNGHVVIESKIGSIIMTRLMCPKCKKAMTRRISWGETKYLYSCDRCNEDDIVSDEIYPYIMFKADGDEYATKWIASSAVDMALDDMYNKGAYDYG